MRRLDRRQAPRAMMNGFVTLTGSRNGATYAAMLRDVSPGGGICVLLDGDSGLTRGTSVEIAFPDGSRVFASVCHNTCDGETWRIGVRFDLGQNGPAAASSTQSPAEVR